MPILTIFTIAHTILAVLICSLLRLSAICLKISSMLRFSLQYRLKLWILILYNLPPSLLGGFGQEVWHSFDGSKEEKYASSVGEYIFPHRGASFLLYHSFFIFTFLLLNFPYFYYLVMLFIKLGNSHVLGEFV